MFTIEPEAEAVALGRDISDQLIKLADSARRSVALVRSGRHGAGSGIIWRSDGLVLTNYHVVAGRMEAYVVLSDDRELPATVIGAEPTLDLAVLRVAANNLAAAAIGLSQSLRVGQLVMAAGNPWGRRGVITLGIVSGLGQVQAPWRKEPSEYIRSDVLLAPGNSGGALLDMRGRVIGINAMIFGGDLSVAIPSDVATQFLLLAEQRSMLGVGVRSVRLPRELVARVRQERGLEIVELLNDGPAAQVGCMVGDLLLRLGNAPLTDAPLLRSALERHSPGARAALQFVRNGVSQTCIVELQGMPKPEQAA
jgi:serine protease Do